MKKGRRCLSRHRKSWIIGQVWAWCYECGAITSTQEGGKWFYPVGPNGKNPAMSKE